MSDGDGRGRGRDPDGLTERLLEAAAEVFVERGYGEAVVTEVARRAGATTGAIYARWPHKNDMMVAALEHLLDQITPEQRMREFGISELPASEILTVWAAYLLVHDAAQDVLVQVFGSARSNDAVQESLRRFLDDQADQLGDLVERGKSEGLFDPALTTASIVLAIQAVGIGTHLLISAERANRHLPGQQDWVELIARMIGGTGPTAD
ncbi:TetR/AcrR family transcriptional regulator [Candidatus Poriferisocius sp.]|uniref:TetR/AcrR family transcriptional regulator n=1 Tax=Candidatus Poriferisocius sp. TaxID=3101276 RepID=UPI003B014511